MKFAKYGFPFVGIFYFSLLATTYAGPAGQTYIGGQYALVTYDESGFGELEPTALVSRFGHYLNDNFAIEGRLGFGLGDDSITIAGTTFTLDVDSLIGAYGIGQYNFTKNLAVYGAIGLTRGEVTVSGRTLGTPVSASDDETDLSLGVGFYFTVGKRVDLNLEYMSYISKSSFDASAIGLGANFRF